MSFLYFSCIKTYKEVSPIIFKNSVSNFKLVLYLSWDCVLGLFLPERRKEGTSPTNTTSTPQLLILCESDAIFKEHYVYLKVSVQVNSPGGWHILYGTLHRVSSLWHLQFRKKEKKEKTDIFCCFVHKSVPVKASVFVKHILPCTFVSFPHIHFWSFDYLYIL